MNGTAVRGLVLGIDPGKVTGLALYAPSSGELVLCQSGSFWDVVRIVMERMYAIPHGYETMPATRGDLLPVVMAVIEDSRRLPIYARNRRREMTREARDKLCRNVGRIDRDIELWAEWLKDLGYAVLLAQPSRASKWNAEKLKQLTGWTDRTNEHGRDAVRLVWGRSGSVPLELLT